jgi:hypothetical protein
MRADKLHIDVLLGQCSGAHLHQSPAHQVDVGVFWTANAQSTVGGKAQMQAKIRAAVVATNAVYAASKLKLRLRLVFMGERDSLPQHPSSPIIQPLNPQQTLSASA